MPDDEENKGVGPAHQPGTQRGEDVKKHEGDEAGRDDNGSSGAGRETGTSIPRDATSVNPEAEAPIDPESPYLLPQ